MYICADSFYIVHQHCTLYIRCIYIYIYAVTCFGIIRMKNSTTSKKTFCRSTNTSPCTKKTKHIHTKIYAYPHRLHITQTHADTYRYTKNMYI